VFHIKPLRLKEWAELKKVNAVYLINTQNDIKWILD